MRGKAILQEEKEGYHRMGTLSQLRDRVQSPDKELQMVVVQADNFPFLTLTLQVIAVVMDVFTDIDIFRDLQEICRKRGVAVYILLDQALLSQFLDMCMDLKVHPEQEKVCITLCLISPQSKVGPIYTAVGSGIPIIREGSEAMSKVVYLLEVSQKRNDRQDSNLGPSLTS